MKFEDYHFMSIGGYCLSLYALGENRIKGPEYKDLLHIIIMCCRVIRSKRGDDYVEILKMTYPNKKYADLLDPVVHFI